MTASSALLCVLSDCQWLRCFLTQVFSIIMSIEIDRWWVKSCRKLKAKHAIFDIRFTKTQPNHFFFFNLLRRVRFLLSIILNTFKILQTWTLCHILDSNRLFRVFLIFFFQSRIMEQFLHFCRPSILSLVAKTKGWWKSDWNLWLNRLCHWVQCRIEISWVCRAGVLVGLRWNILNLLVHWLILDHLLVWILDIGTFQQSLEQHVLLKRMIEFKNRFSSNIFVFHLHYP